MNIWLRSVSCGAPSNVLYFVSRMSHGRPDRRSTMSSRPFSRRDSSSQIDSWALTLNRGWVANCWLR